MNLTPLRCKTASVLRLGRTQMRLARTPQATYNYPFMYSLRRTKQGQVEQT